MRQELTRRVRQTSGMMIVYLFFFACLFVLQAFGCSKHEMGVEGPRVRSAVKVPGAKPKLGLRMRQGD